MFRELGKHEQSILSARDLIASELRSNADIIARREKSPTDWIKISSQLQFAAWDQHGAKLSVFRKRHLMLWEEIVAAYESLHQWQFSVGPGIKSHELRQLAARLASTEV